MCDPTVLTAASTGLSLLNAKGQYGRQLDAAEQVEDAASKNALRQYAAIQTRQVQERAKATQAIQESARSARRAAGTAAVASAEAGVAGASVAALQGEFERTALEFEGTTIRSQAFLDAHFKDQSEQVRAEQEATVQDAYNQIKQPNYLGILIKGLGSFLEIKGQNDALKPLGGTPILYPDID